MEDIIVVYIYTDPFKLDGADTKYSRVTTHTTPVLTTAVYKRNSLEHIKRYIVNTLNIWNEVYRNRYITSDDMSILAHRFISGLAAVADPGLFQILHREAKIIKNTLRTEFHICVGPLSCTRVYVYSIDPCKGPSKEKPEIKCLGLHSWETIGLSILKPKTML